MSEQESGLETFRNRVPQWRLSGLVYFVTWRLMASHPPLAPAERALVASTLKHFHGERYRIYAYVVMDDHVHVLVQPLDEYQLSKILHSWKSFTANQLQRKSPRRGSIWQKDNYTHIIRDEEDFFQKAEYILNNPRKRWPDNREYEWAEYIE